MLDAVSCNLSLRTYPYLQGTILNFVSHEFYFIIVTAGVIIQMYFRSFMFHDLWPSRLRIESLRFMINVGLKALFGSLSFRGLLAATEDERFTRDLLATHTQCSPSSAVSYIASLEWSFLRHSPKTFRDPMRCRIPQE